MAESNLRLTLGIVLALLVTLLLASVVVTSAAVTIELSDGDGCETGSGSDRETTASPDGVSTVAGTVTECITGDRDDANGSSEQRSGVD